MKHKEKVKNQDIEKFRKEQADYMRDYMKQRRLREKQEKKKGTAMTTLADAMRARKARKELQARAIERATGTAEKLGNIAKEARELTKGAKRNN